MLGVVPTPLSSSSRTSSFLPSSLTKTDILDALAMTRFVPTKMQADKGRNIIMVLRRYWRVVPKKFLWYYVGFFRRLYQRELRLDKTQQNKTERNKWILNLCASENLMNLMVVRQSRLRPCRKETDESWIFMLQRIWWIWRWSGNPASGHANALRRYWRVAPKRFLWYVCFFRR